MGNKTKRKKSNEQLSREDRIMRVLSNLVHKELQKECILRGMPFEMVHGSHPALVSWFFENFENTQDPQLLVQFDLYIDDVLEKAGYKAGEGLRSPSLRFGFYGDDRENSLNKPQDIKPNSVPKPEKKPKAQIDEKTGVRAGTKKAMTFQLAQEGKALDEIKKAVIAAFPDAQEKSIKIWMKKALKNKK